jgi:hypothetical protein
MEGGSRGLMPATRISAARATIAPPGADLTRSMEIRVTIEGVLQVSRLATFKSLGSGKESAYDEKNHVKGSPGADQKTTGSPSFFTNVLRILICPLLFSFLVPLPLWSVSIFDHLVTY